MKEISFPDLVRDFWNSIAFFVMVRRDPVVKKLERPTLTINKLPKFVEELLKELRSDKPKDKQQGTNERGRRDPVE